MHTKFLPALSGEPKMSASKSTDTIYLNDSEEDVRAKIGRAFTGQQATAELQRKYGGDQTLHAILSFSMQGKRSLQSPWWISLIASVGLCGRETPVAAAISSVNTIVSHPTIDGSHQV